MKTIISVTLQTCLVRAWEYRDISPALKCRLGKLMLVTYLALARTRRRGILGWQQMHIKIIADDVDGSITT